MSPNDAASNTTAAMWLTILLTEVFAVLLPVAFVTPADSRSDRTLAACILCIVVNVFTLIEEAAGGKLSKYANTVCDGLCERFGLFGRHASGTTAAPKDGSDQTEGFETSFITSSILCFLMGWGVVAETYYTDVKTLVDLMTKNVFDCDGTAKAMAAFAETRWTAELAVSEVGSGIQAAFTDFCEPPEFREMVKQRAWAAVKHEHAQSRTIGTFMVYVYLCLAVLMGSAHPLVLLIPITNC